MTKPLCHGVSVGGYCEWQLTSAAIKDAVAGKVYQCFEEFQSDLSLSCADSSIGYTDFKWTPTADTPDLVYYQVSVGANTVHRLSLAGQHSIL